MSIELLAKAIDGFTRELDATEESDFGRLTMCDGWDVTSLLRHVVGGTVATNMALRGRTRDEMRSVFPTYDFRRGIRDDYAAHVADHLADFRKLEDLSIIVQHPMMDMPAGQLLGFRIVDFTIHTWDLAAGLGRSVELDSDLLEYCWDSLSPMAQGLAATGQFGEGPSQQMTEDAGLQVRLLDLTGRRGHSSER